MADVCEKHNVKLLTYGTLVSLQYVFGFTTSVLITFSVVVSLQIGGLVPPSRICIPVLLRLLSAR